MDSLLFDDKTTEQIRKRMLSSKEDPLKDNDEDRDCISLRFKYWSIRELIIKYYDGEDG